MAALSASDRRDVWREIMRDPQGNFGLTKQELRDAVDALDDWLDANAATLRQAGCCWR